MSKHLVYLFLLTVLSSSVFSQKRIKVDLNQNKQFEKKSEIVKQNSNGLVLSEKISAFELIEKETQEGIYSQMISEGMSKTYNPGKPDLPVINRLIQIPFNSEVKIKVISSDEEIIDLKDYNFTQLIIPAQASVSKSKDISDVPFVKDNEVYSKNDFYKNELVKFEDKGYLRDKHLGYIEISPFSYNPVSNTLKVLNNIEIEISFVPKKNIKTTNISKLKSPYFENLTLNTINETDDSKALVSGPVKYVIVSDRMFGETLQSFVEWKTMKGFNVIEAYTDVIGKTTTDIKNYLQDLYDNSSDGISPTFVLIVGDVDQVPTFDGVSDSHKTDLYYFEYTGDDLPEVFYGRFSAESTDELQPQIDKTLEIEKYEMPDPSYLDKVILVAGVDSEHAPTYGNGAINYANSYYTNVDNGITSYSYLYNDASGVMASNNTEASASIRSYINSGVSFTNYTAHCSSSGWADPSFSISNIADLTNEHMYPLIIGNCCQSNTFVDNDCFGEKILMAEGKGAVGYIGGSNSTYWDEDYYWGVGLTGSITANPTYDNSGLGAYDRFFHLNGEAKEDWYITQGQINVAGNLAVEASTSSLKTYYWEIYHLMGDPSLTPYVTVPEVLMASYNAEIIKGSSSFKVSTEEDAYVAISKDGVLLNAQLAGETGKVELNFDPLAGDGELDLVITKQNRQPKIDKITIIPATTPYVIVDYYVIDDTQGNSNSQVDYAETIKLDVQFKNVSDSNALIVVANLNTVDTNIIIIDYTEDIGTILKSDSSFVKGAFTLELKEKFSDQQKIALKINILGEDGFESHSIVNFPVNAPELELKDGFVDDQTGNNDGILDPGETANLNFIIQNNGHAGIKNLSGFIEQTVGSSYFTIVKNEVEPFELKENELDTITFVVSVDEQAKLDSVMGVNIKLIDQDYNFYSIAKDFEFIISYVPEYLISQGGVIKLQTGKLYFYDSGGENNNYSAEENYTITFLPRNKGELVGAKFLDFDVESNENGGCYDYLAVYDGIDDTSLKIGEYCGANSATELTASNSNGALTFVFHSDGYVQNSGWKAEISSKESYQVLFIVSDENGFVENATVKFNDSEVITDETGEAVFNNVSPGTDLQYIVSKNGYKTDTITMTVDSDETENMQIKFVGYLATFVVVGPDNHAIQDVLVTFNDKSSYTNSDGEAVFNEVLPGENLNFQLKKDGYWDYDSSITIVDKDVVFNAQLSSTTETTKINSSNIKIYPNPSSGVFNVEITEIQNKVYRFKVFNIIGELIYATEIHGSAIVNQQIDISQKAKGMYFLSVESENGIVLSKRIIIK